MARSIWSGSISFGLVNVPVKLYPAVRSHDLRFNQFEKGTTSRIRYRRISERNGEEVPLDRIVRGYELSRGNYVMIEDEELERLRPAATHTVEIERFVNLGEIDPAYFETTYFVAPSTASAAVAKAYSLLRSVMDKEAKVAIGRVVMRSKQHLAALRPFQGRLGLSTMLFADELVSPASLPELAFEAPEPSERELAMASQLLESLAGPWEPEAFQDTYRQEVLQLIDQKAAGRPFAEPEEPAEPAGEVIDMMAALEASLAAMRKSPAPQGRAGVAGRGGKPLESMSLAQLAQLAREAGIPGRSKMSRRQLISALSRSEAAAGPRGRRSA